MLVLPSCLPLFLCFSLKVQNCCLVVVVVVVFQLVEQCFRLLQVVQCVRRFSLKKKSWLRLLQVV